MVACKTDREIELHYGVPKEGTPANQVGKQSWRAAETWQRSNVQPSVSSGLR